MGNGRSCTCGNRDCLEAVASTSAIFELFSRARFKMACKLTPVILFFDAYKYIAFIHQSFDSTSVYHPLLHKSWQYCGRVSS